MPATGRRVSGALSATQRGLRSVQTLAPDGLIFGKGPWGGALVLATALHERPRKGGGQEGLAQLGSIGMVKMA